MIDRNKGINVMHEYDKDNTKILFFIQWTQTKTPIH